MVTDHREVRAKILGDSLAATVERDLEQPRRGLGEDDATVGRDETGLRAERARRHHHLDGSDRPRTIRVDECLLLVEAPALGVRFR